MIIRIYDIFCFYKARVCRYFAPKPKIKISESESLLEKSSARVLIIEVNDFHEVTLDSVIFYFHSLKLSCDLLVNANLNLESLKYLNLCERVYKLNSAQILSQLKHAETYDFIFLNTITFKQCCLVDFFKEKSKVFGFMHTLEEIEEFHLKNLTHNFFILRENLKNKYLLKMLSPSVPNNALTFESESELDSNFAQDSSEIIFLSAGFYTQYRRFRKNLKKIILFLRQNNIRARFILISRNALKIDENEFVKIFINPPNLDEIISLEKPDFILGLFDSFAHKHYLNGVTSGLRALCLKHNIPPLINAPFFKSFDFSDKNAIIFDDLKDGILRAIEIKNSAKYELLRENLKNLNEYFMKTSIENLKDAIAHKNTSADSNK